MLQLLNFSCMWMLVKFRMPVCRWQIQSNERHKSEVVGASITFCLIPQKILNIVATAKMGYAPKMAMEWRRWGPKWASNNGDNGDNENKASGTWHVAATGSTPQDSQPYDGILRATFETCAILHVHSYHYQTDDVIKWHEEFVTQNMYSAITSELAGYGSQSPFCQVRIFALAESVWSQIYVYI